MSSDSLDPFELYEHYDVPRIFAPLSDRFIDWIAPCPGDRILDLACGTGILARKMAPFVGETGRVVGVDINPGMLRVARQQSQPQGAIVYHEGDAVTLDMPAEQFDLVLCQQGLQFFSQKEAALSRAKRFLRPGGRLGLAIWQGLNQQPLFAEFAKIEAQHLEPLGISFDELVVPFSLGDTQYLKELLHAAGFTEITIVPHSLEVQFPSPETFARKMETAYGAVIPAFVQNPDRFADYLDTIEAQTRELVQSYTVGDVVRFEMPTHFIAAR